jgi:glycosyltransferase involved in cell wall biosynthesis
MPDRRFRVLTIATHPVQYAAPVLRRMAVCPELDSHVAYCSLRGAEPGLDPEFETTVQWDVPLLDGYDWTHVPNRGSGGDSFLGLRNAGLWHLIRGGNFDAVLCYVGYVRASFWIAYLAARSCGVPFLFGTDASTIAPRDGRIWKHIFKRLWWPLLFRLADQVLTASSAGYSMMSCLGIPKDRISMTMDTVDNDWWLGEASRADRAATRGSWGTNESEKIIVFCGKLQPWKGPLELLHAFAKAAVPQSTLVFAGEGPLRSQIEEEARALGIIDRIRMLGFVNQSKLPAVYKASDVMVIPSRYEPFGLVVNEAMLCGCAVVASDRVGAIRDLIVPGQTGFVYPCGEASALAAVLQQALADPARLFNIREAALARMQGWSQSTCVAALVEAIARAVSRKRSLRAPTLQRSGWLDITLGTWIVAAQIWYYLQFREQFRSILWLTLRKLWR